MENCLEYELEVLSWENWADIYSRCHSFSNYLQRAEKISLSITCGPGNRGLDVSAAGYPGTKNSLLPINATTPSANRGVLYDDTSTTAGSNSQTFNHRFSIEK